MGEPRISAAMVAAGRTLADPRLSPDGERVAMVSSADGRSQVVVVPAGGGPELVVATDPAPRPAPSLGGGVLDWTPDGQRLVYAAAAGGLWVAPASGGPARPVVERGSIASPVVSPDGARVAYVLDERHVAVASIAAGGPWPVRLSDAPDFALDPSWSADGGWVAWHEWDVPAMPWDESRWVVASADGSGVRASLAPDGAALQQARFAPTGADLAYLCDATGWLNLWVFGPGRDLEAPLVGEPFEHGDPPWGPGQRSFAWSPDGAAIAFARNERGFGRLCVVDVASGSVREVATGVHGGLSWAAGRLAAVRSGARTPTQVVVYDTATWERTTVARGPVGGFEAAELPEPEAVTWSADDGATLHGRLYRRGSGPDGGEPPPLLLWIHGGPTGQWPVTFNPRLAFFVDRGWAVLLVDHRGSTGHGRDYAQALRGRWGVLDVADAASGLRVAAERGWGHPRRLVPMGGSAGGFTVLNLLAHAPERCAAGVVLYGVSDLLWLDETTHRFEQHYCHRMVGPLPDAADEYRRRSPVTVADRVRSPVLLLHGTDDRVVPPDQTERLAARLRDGGTAVEVHWYEGEGHGWQRSETVRDELERIESFLRRHVLRWQP
ncbi:MAG: S9 family peptidase [Acidimicrobiales bacterium]|nr:S9 family peptidase [Acidimicrobiales bacterium]